MPPDRALLKHRVLLIHRLLTQRVSNLYDHRVTRISEHSMSEHSMYEQHVWIFFAGILRVLILYMSSMCKHSMYRSMCEHRVWILHVTTMCKQHVQHIWMRYKSSWYMTTYKVLTHIECSCIEDSQHYSYNQCSYRVAIFKIIQYKVLTHATPT